MKKKIVFLLLNSIPFFLLSVFLYDGGIIIDLLFIPLQMTAVYINYKFIESNKLYILFNIILIISSVISLRISTQMYYNNISSDAETLAVGQFAGYIATIFIGIISIIGLVIRKIRSGTSFNKIEK